MADERLTQAERTNSQIRAHYLSMPGKTEDGWRAVKQNPAKYNLVWRHMLKLQAGEQAGRDKIPALAYRVDRHDWRVIVPLHVFDGICGPFSGLDNNGTYFSPLVWTAEISLPAFAALVRESI